MRSQFVGEENGVSELTSATRCRATATNFVEVGFGGPIEESSGSFRLVLCPIADGESAPTAQTVGEIANRDLTAQFIADITEQVLQATAILLLTPATKESVPTLLLTLLEQLPDNSFFDKPVLLFANGGLPAHVPVLERSLRHELLRLGTTTIAARVHIGSGSWITVANDRPRLSRSAETEIAYSIGIVLRRIQLRESKDFSRELARR
jgi:NAD(P)H-dependent FMN reductase